MTADVTVSVPELRSDWSATLKDGERIELPGFPLELEDFFDADFYLEFSLKKENGAVNFKVFYLLSRMTFVSPSEGFREQGIIYGHKIIGNKGTKGK